MMRRKTLLYGAVLSAMTSGIIMGLGFVAAAAKFRATKPSLLQLLDVGHEQFRALHLIEWVLVPFSSLLVWQGSRACRPIVSVSAVLFLVQSLAILPPLEARMIAKLNGAMVPDSALHFAYVGVAGALFISLVLMSIRAISVLESC